MTAAIAYAGIAESIETIRTARAGWRGYAARYRYVALPRHRRSPAPVPARTPVERLNDVNDRVTVTVAGVACATVVGVLTWLIGSL